MAHIFAGADRGQIDAEVLEAFKTLPDDFWVFAEFTIARNVDWLVVRPDPAGTLALIMVELKRTGLPLAGDLNNTWQQLTDEGWREIAANGPSRNYYWQAVETANELKEWLWNNQRRYRAAGELLPPEALKVWPDLLILSPPGVMHQLPLKPTNNFGRFLFSLDECVRHIAGWNARQRNLVPLTEGEMLRLADALGLERIWSPTAEAPPDREPAPEQEADLGQVLALLRRLDERLQRLEDRLASLGEPRPASLPSVANGFAPPPETVFGWIDEYLREPTTVRPCPFTTLGHQLKKRHGFDAKLQYHTTLTDLMRQVEREGRVRVDYLGGFPYASLPEDPVPAAAPRPAPTAVLDKLGERWLGEAVRLIAAAEDAIGGQPAQTGSLLKELREALPWQGGPALSNHEANELLKEELVRLGYVVPIRFVNGVDPITGGLRRTEGFRLVREHEAVRHVLEQGTAALHPEIEIRPLQGGEARAARPAV